MSTHTRSQQVAQAAYAQVARHGRPSKEYASTAKKFPALIHACGLAQAVAFALAKKESDYLTDLAKTLRAAGHPEIEGPDSLDREARNQPLSGYLRLSRDAIRAAGWLKRYVEAVAEED